MPRPKLNDDDYSVMTIKIHKSARKTVDDFKKRIHAKSYADAFEQMAKQINKLDQFQEKNDGHLYIHYHDGTRAKVLLL